MLTPLHRGTPERSKRAGLLALCLAAMLLAGCGGDATVSANPGVCSMPAIDLLNSLYQFERDHRACQQASDCVAVGLFRGSCDCGPALPLAVSRPAKTGAQKLIDEVTACGDVPTLCDDFATQRVSCVNGACETGIQRCAPPDAAITAGGSDAAPADARPRDAAPADAGPADARPPDAGPADAGM